MRSGSLPQPEVETATKSSPTGARVRENRQASAFTRKTFAMPSTRPVAIALATSAFYAGIFVTNAHAEMHYVRVTLTTGQQLTITVDIPPGTPVEQLQIPGLPAPVQSIVDLGSTESTP